MALGVCHTPQVLTSTQQVYMGSGGYVHNVQNLVLAIGIAEWGFVLSRYFNAYIRQKGFENMEAPEFLEMLKYANEKNMFCPRGILIGEADLNTLLAGPGLWQMYSASKVTVEGQIIKVGY